MRGRSRGTCLFWNFISLSLRLVVVTSFEDTLQPAIYSLSCPTQGILQKAVAECNCLFWNTLKKGSTFAFSGVLSRLEVCGTHGPTDAAAGLRISVGDTRVTTGRTGPAGPARSAAAVKSRGREGESERAAVKSLRSTARRGRSAG